MARTHDGSTFLLGSGIAATALSAGLSGGIWWLYATFSFDATIDKELRQEAALGLGVAALALAVLGSFCWWYYRAPGWSLSVVALVTAALAAGAADQIGDASTASPSEFEVFTADELWLLAACPTSWPLLLLAAWPMVRLFRGSSSPAPR